MWNIKSKICLITGATSGIGKETALALAQMGARVMITYRDVYKAEETISYIREATGQEIETFFCDFSHFESIRDFAAYFLQKHDTLHVLINNAGIQETDRTLSKDGIELNFAINHLAPFLLTNLLLETLKKSSPARIINVSSESHKGSIINFEDIELKKGYSGFKAYGQSKLANILFTKHLAKQLQETDVSVNCLHPGLVSTNIFNKMNKLSIALIKPIMISPKKGAETSVFLASSDNINDISGKYFKKKKAINSSAASNDLHAAQKLWQLSRNYVGLK